MMGERLNPMRGALMYPSNKNLLDNWHFRNPVNQQGQLQYSSSAAAYTIDRWGENGSGNLTVNDGSISIVPGASGNTYFWQRLDESFDDIVGKTFTMSILTEDNLYFGTVILSETANDPQNYAYKDDSLYLHFYKDGTSGLPLFLIGVYPAKNGCQGLIAAKLEEGPYQTLAHKEGDQWVLNDPEPNYQQELAKCQRYQVYYSSIPACGYLTNSKNNLGVIVTLPVTLRGTPTVKVGSITHIRFATGSNIAPGSFSVSTIGFYGNVVLIDFSVTGFTDSGYNNNVPCVLYLNDLLIDGNL